LRGGYGRIEKALVLTRPRKNGNLGIGIMSSRFRTYAIKRQQHRYGDEAITSINCNNCRLEILDGQHFVSKRVKKHKYFHLDCAKRIGIV